MKWRTGSEARIACLKRDYLWRRSLFDTLEGTATWSGWGVLAHNSVKLTALAAARDHPNTTDEPRPAPGPAPTHPPPPPAPPPDPGHPAAPGAPRQPRTGRKGAQSSRTGRDEAT